MSEVKIEPTKLAFAQEAYRVFTDKKEVVVLLTKPTAVIPNKWLVDVNGKWARLISKEQAIAFATEKVKE